jgi:tetratricopeptide (TPR) repeat protein
MTPRYWKILACLLLAVAAFGAYEGVRHHQFINIDDDLCVTENPIVQEGLTLKSLTWAITTTHTGNWIPLTWLTHIAACQVFGLHAGGHLLINLLFHLANTLLLFLLLLRATQSLGPSFLVAALFALHPLHVESVAWVAERKDVLSTFFWLSTMFAYVWYVESPGIRRYFAVMACFIAGLLSKPMLVTLPFVLLLMDYWPLGRWSPYRATAASPAKTKPGSAVDNTVPLRRLIMEKVPLLVLTVPFCLITVYAQEKFGAVKNLTGLPLLNRLANALVTYITYMRKMVWPSDLAPYYPHPEHALPLWQGLVAGLVLLALSLFIIRQARRRPYLLMGWLWYVGTLVPVIGLVQVGDQALADRYTYVPLIGLFIIVAWGLRDLTAGRRFAQVLAPLTAGILLSALALCTWFQVRIWRDSMTLYEHTLRVTHKNFFIHNNLGHLLYRQGKVDQAMVHYREALKLRPHYYLALNNLGAALYSKGQLDQAIHYYKESIRSKPDYPLPHCNLGNALVEKGQTDQAIVHCKEALRLNPDFADAHNNLGIALASQNNGDEAIFHYTEAIRLNSRHYKAHYNLANSLVSCGKVDEAIFHYKESLRLLPTFSPAHISLGNALLSQGKVEQALAYYAEAVRLRPDYAMARYKLGMALAMQGKLDQAVLQYREAIRLKPDYAQASNNLAWILATAADRKLRDGLAAVHLAEQANQLTGYNQPGTMDTLAAAYAEAGRFPEAIQAAQKAMDFARCGGQTKLFGEIEARLRLYQAGLPNHVGVGNPDSPP